MLRFQIVLVISLFLFSCGGGGGGSFVAPTVADNESSLSITSSHTSQVESTSGNITFSLSPAPVAACTITLAADTNSSYATYGSDYSLESTTINVNASVTDISAPITFINDSVYESTETYKVDVISTTCGSFSAGGLSAQGTILESSSEPTLSITSSASTVFENGDNVTVTVSQSMARAVQFGIAIQVTGNATRDTDYTISGFAECDGSSSTQWVCIPAGNTSTTLTFNPTMDYTSEGDETAVVEVTYPTGLSVSRTITIDEIGLETQTAFVDQGSNMHNTKQALTEYMNMSYLVDQAHTNDTASRIHEYEQLNIHKVWSHKDGNDQYLDGTGEYISIFDMGCDWNHIEFETQRNANLIKSWGNFSTDTEHSYDGDWTLGNSHCNAVASFAAADYKGSTGNSKEIMGVAYNAGLHFVDVDENAGNESSNWASGLNDARQYKPIVNNNSWYVGTWYDSANTLITNNHSGSADNYWATIVNGGTSGQQVSDWQDYITALNNFQNGDGDGVNGGIIVFAAGNTSSEDEPTAQSALPLYYSQLAEAWLVVTYFENTETHSLASNWDGTFSAGNITRLGNQCGSAKEFCLAMDAHGLNSAEAHIDGNSMYTADYWTNAANNRVNSGSDTNLASLSGGTSYAAPMLSGGIALLAQAFPNHNVAQLTDRILASANNTWFTSSGNTTFTTNGASINHGYHAEWGHGVPDFYAALQPIVNSSNPLSSLGIPLNNRLGPSENNQPLYSSLLSLSSPFGDAMIKGLENETLYFYDALNGGFKINLSGLISNPESPTISNSLVNDIEQLQYYISSSNKFLTKNFFNTQNLPKQTKLTIDAPNIAVQNFNNSSDLVFNSNSTNPFINKKDKGIGINKELNIFNHNILFGYHNTKIHTSGIESQDKVENLSFSISGNNNFFGDYTLLSGVMLEHDALLNTKGYSAFSLEDSKNRSYYLGLSMNKKINDFDIGLISLLGYSNLNNDMPSLINDFSDIYTSNYQFKFKKNNLFNKFDSLKVHLEQPLRIEKGSINMKLPGMALSNGMIPYNNISSDIEPSGRQINIGLEYQMNPKENIAFGIKSLIMKDANHIKNNNLQNYLSFVAKLSF